MLLTTPSSRAGARCQELYPRGMRGQWGLAVRSMGKLAAMRRLVVLAVAVLLVLVGCGSAEEVTATPETVVGGTTGATETGEAGETGETETAETETGETGETGGGGGQGDPQAGEEVFASAGCGTCHTFEPAGATGAAAPSLDDSDASYDEAYQQIAEGGGGMPAFKDQLDEQQIADVTAFVVESRGGG